MERPAPWLWKPIATRLREQEQCSGVEFCHRPTDAIRRPDLFFASHGPQWCRLSAVSMRKSKTTMMIKRMMINTVGVISEMM
jgi:hypothetical protein